MTIERTRRIQERMAPLAARIERFHRREDGMYSMVSLIVILMLLILYGMVGNAAKTVRDRIRLQNAADSAAYSGAVWMARAMNVVTMTNHMIGEMMAFVVIHHAFGGPELDEGSAPDGQAWTNSALETAAEVADLIGFDALAPNFMEGEIEAGATIFHAKLRLKRIETVVLGLGSVGELLSKVKWPPAVVIGKAIVIFCRVMDGWVLAEWAALTVIENIARATVPLKQALWRAIQASALYTKALVGAAPHLANRTAQYLGQKNVCTAAVWPEPGGFGSPGYTFLRLPLSNDPASDGSIRFSQIVRASYPWVAYHRRPILTVLWPFFLSKAQEFYHKFSEEFSLERPRELYTTPAFRLLMVDGATPEQKGREPWRRNWPTAERMFCLVGLAHRNRPTVLAPTYFGIRENDRGMMAFAQAMIYNASFEIPRGGAQQSILAWDTLNWRSGDLPEHPGEVQGFLAVAGGGALGGAPAGGDECPTVQVNWQALMVPAGRLDEIGMGAGVPPPAPFGGVVERMVLPIPGAMRNH